MLTLFRAESTLVDDSDAKELEVCAVTIFPDVVLIAASMLEEDAAMLRLDVCRVVIFVFVVFKSASMLDDEFESSALV